MAEFALVVYLLQKEWRGGVAFPLSCLVCWTMDLAARESLVPRDVVSDDPHVDGLYSLLLGVLDVPGGLELSDGSEGLGGFCVAWMNCVRESES